MSWYLSATFDEDAEWRVLQPGHTAWDEGTADLQVFSLHLGCLLCYLQARLIS